MNIASDYKAAVTDMVQDMKQAPKKTTFYLTLLASGAMLAKTNPSQTSFEVMLSDCHHDLLLLGDPIRNRHSDAFIQMLQENYRAGTIRYTNCGLFSLMWLAGYDPAVDKFEAQSGLVKPRWVDFHKQIVDVGVLGRWHAIHKAMFEFDVNPDEWDEQGRMVKKAPPPESLDPPSQ